MAQELALFWLVLLGFLLADSALLLSAGGEALRLDRRGRPRYRPGLRLLLLRRESVWMNPLNPWDRLLPAPQALGGLTAPLLRREHQALRPLLRAAAPLHWLGAVYLLGLALLALLSWHAHAGLVLASLLALHLLLWSLSSLLVLWRRGALGLTAGQAAALLFEALLVPAYTLNLGKRLLRRHACALPALGLGLRQWRRLRQQDPEAAALLALQLRGRLDELEQELAPADRVGAQWLGQARQALST